MFGYLFRLLIKSFEVIHLLSRIYGLIATLSAQCWAPWTRVGETVVSQ